MFEEDFESVLDALKAQPTSEVKERLAEEGDAELADGRLVRDVFAELDELAHLLEDRWSQGGLDRLPTGVKGTLIHRMSEVQDACEKYGTEEAGITLVVKQVNNLHAFLWQYNQIDTSQEVVGLEEKTRQLESLRRDAEDALNRLNDALEVGERVTGIRNSLEEILEESHTELDEIRKRRSELEETVDKVSQQRSTAATASEEVERLEEKTESAKQRAQQAADEANAKAEKINTFFSQIEQHRTTMEETEKSANETLEDYETQMQQMLDTVRTQQKEIDKQLQKATSASLFGAFSDRRSKLTTAKWIWAVVSVVSLGFTVWWGAELADRVATADAAFFIRLGAVIPLLAVVVFSMTQYGRERKAEEEYAFKSALSLSLVPYKDLIENLERDDLSEDYPSFLIETIEKIYKRPAVLEEEIGAGKDSVSLGHVERLFKIAQRVFK